MYRIALFIIIIIIIIIIIACMKCIRCGLLLQMPHVAWCVCLCAGHAGKLYRDAIFGADLWGPRNHLLDGSQDRTNPFAAARGDKMAMWPLAKLLWTLVKHADSMHKSEIIVYFLLSIGECYDLLACARNTLLLSCDLTKYCDLDAAHHQSTSTFSM